VGARRVTDHTAVGRDLARDQLAFPNIPELIPTWCDDGTNDEAELMRYCERPNILRDLVTNWN